MDMKQRMELLIMVGEDNLNTHWVPEGGFEMLQVFGTPLFGTCIVFSIAVAKTGVNYDGKGGTAPDPLIVVQRSFDQKSPK